MIGSFKQLDQKRQKLDASRPNMNFTNPVFSSVWFLMFGSISSGVMMALSFPDFGNPTLAFASLVPLMFAVQSASIKKASWLALLSGFSFFMASLYWLKNLTGTVEGIGMKFSALFGYSMLALVCAVYFIPFAITVALGTKRWLGDNIWQNVRFMFCVTMVWVGSEYLRGILFFKGFPWNALGISQYSNLTIIQVAELGGVAMVSAYIVWLNAGIFVTFRQYTHGTRMKKYRPHFELMIGILPLAISIGYGMNILFNQPKYIEQVQVALVQPNIAQEEKWDPKQDILIREQLEELTSTAMNWENVDLIIWPETALPDYVRTSRASYDLVQRMTAGDIPLLVGTMDVELSEAGRTYYNSSVLFGKDGAELGKYDKQHLVPFGEYVPFPKVMRKFTPIPIDFTHGKKSTVLPLHGKAPFSVLICFEDIVAPLSAAAVKNGARWLVNQSNDAWFDPSAQSEQHLAHAVFRCIENRVPMARCCNTGVSATIDAYGQVDRVLDLRVADVRTGRLNPRPAGMPYTYYTRHPDAFSKAALLVGALALISLCFEEWKRKKKPEA